MKKIALLVPVFCWMLLTGVDMWSFFFQKEKPMYFRAWEYVINEGKDSYYVPFQPLIRYEGKMEGDLLHFARLLSKEKRTQIVQVDEYGFRNAPGLLKKPVDVVIAGTSFVGGAAETQSNLISTLLNSRHGIAAYNYATVPLQHFWEDERFVKKPPRYVVTIANESEIIGGSWVEKIASTSAVHSVPAWQSHDQWSRSQGKPVLTITNILQDTRRFSLVRHLAGLTKKYVLNRVFDRALIVLLFGENVMYQSSDDLLFLKSSFDPRDTVSNRQLIKNELAILSETARVLATRDIQYILVVVPSKSSLYDSKFRNIPLAQRTLFVLEQQLSKADITYIPLLEEMYQSVRKEKAQFYYDDDGHWNSRTNLLIAEKLSQLIQ